MKETQVISLLLLCMVLGVLVSESTATFKSCYESCFILCVITPNHSAMSCPFECLKDCIQPEFPLDNTHRDNNYFCKLGCASSLCANFSTKEFPSSILLDEEKVDRCVDSCSHTCTKI